MLLWEIFSYGKTPYAFMTNAQVKQAVLKHAYTPAHHEFCSQGAGPGKAASLKTIEVLIATDRSAEIDASAGQELAMPVLLAECWSFKHEGRPAMADLCDYFDELRDSVSF